MCKFCILNWKIDDKYLNFHSLDNYNQPISYHFVLDVSTFGLRQQKLKIPVCVFISSHSESAAETFELQTLDFIVKPFKFSRFEQSVKRIEEFMEVRLKASLFESDTQISNQMI